MTSLTLVHHAYEWRGGRERLVQIGTGGKAILFLAPLFEEANRTRFFLLETMRTLALRGFSCFLPDLPGTLESCTPLEAVTWLDWEDAVAAVSALISGPHAIASFRGGALLDSAVDAQGRWRLTPADGAALLRELIRIRLAADREEGVATSMAAIEEAALAAPFEIAGYRLSPDFLRMLKARSVDEGAVRTVRLENDAQTADAKIAGQPLWRRSEPGHDPDFSQLIADDISEWMTSCDNG